MTCIEPQRQSRSFSSFRKLSLCHRHFAPDGYVVHSFITTIACSDFHPIHCLKFHSFSTYIQDYLSDTGGSPLLPCITFPACHSLCTGEVPVFIVLISNRNTAFTQRLKSQPPLLQLSQIYSLNIRWRYFIRDSLPVRPAILPPPLVWVLGRLSGRITRLCSTSGHFAFRILQR